MKGDRSGCEPSVPAGLVQRLLLLAVEHEQPERAADDAVPALMAACGGDFAAWVRAGRGKWQVLASAGLDAQLPWELVAEALDRETVCRDDRWYAAAMPRRLAAGEALVVRVAHHEYEPDVATLAALLGAALAVVRHRHGQQRRVERLETVLEIAAQWNRSRETDELLVQMAEAAVTLLDAERASIFLWDRRTKTLVGRPALGIDGGELRIPDDRGVVGQVVHTGRALRVDADRADGEIDRAVDQDTGFRTRNALCVPLRAPGGALFGAFEVLNRRCGDFSEEDQTALTELADHAAVALENTQQYEQLLRVRNQMADQAAQQVRLIGQCPAIEALRSTIARIADTDLAILILGENGTGKEVVAQQIHFLSRRRHEPFIAVNCAALAETLLESELFGHEKGAFTDAREARPGKFELAAGGTLLLDEIGDMSPSGQAKLLRVLEEKVVVRVGGSTPIATDARVIAASNQDLAKMVREKRFREDLFFRLNVVAIDLPPLRERGEDIALLADYFLREFCGKARRRRPKFTAAARRRLLAHPWPGNVRELRNLMERLAYLSQGDTIDADQLTFLLTPDTRSQAIFSLNVPLSGATRRFQIEYIRKHIDAARGSMTDAAARLGLHRSNLYRKMRQLGMDADSP